MRNDSPGRSGACLPALLAAVLLASGRLAAGAGDLSINSFWIEEGSPGLQVLAGYVDIENTSDQPRALHSVSTPDAEQVMIHETLIHDGMASMRALESLNIPAHAHAMLKPGGVHLMIVHPRRALREGDTVAFEFQFDGNQSIRTTASVRRVESPPAR